MFSGRPAAPVVRLASEVVYVIDRIRTRRAQSLVITVFRQWAARREVVIAAGQSGKYKAFIQNLFIGGALLWFPLQGLAIPEGWDHPAWNAFEWLHEVWIGIMLAAALFLTVYSMIDYFWSYRALIRGRG